MPGDDIDTENVDLLRAYLANADASCPKCSYNLRGVESAACPECGRALSLSVRVAGLKLRWWLVAVIALAMSLGSLVLDGVDYHLCGSFTILARREAMIGYVLFLPWMAGLVGIGSVALFRLLLRQPGPRPGASRVLRVSAGWAWVSVVLASGAVFAMTTVFVEIHPWRVASVTTTAIQWPWVAVAACIAGSLVAVACGQRRTAWSQRRLAAIAFVVSAWLWSMAMFLTSEVDHLVASRTSGLPARYWAVPMEYYLLMNVLLWFFIGASTLVALLAAVRHRRRWCRLPAGEQIALACLACVPYALLGALDVVRVLWR
ncbi:MAG: hypothetical protein KAS72_00910 [Phycisphaerales bacterium]|nr:hypothetical protein [Phycisphaerales bacterium]